MLKNLFKKQKKESSNNKNILVTALLIHAAKIDENYTEKEKNIIKKALMELNNLEATKIDEIMKLAEKKEKESNQILEFTKEIKKYEKDFRLKIIEVLWNIIYSDGISDMYESNLMRRLSKLLYVSDKECGEIKQSVIGNI